MDLRAGDRNGRRRAAEFAVGARVDTREDVSFDDVAGVIVDTVCVMSCVSMRPHSTWASEGTGTRTVLVPEVGDAEVETGADGVRAYCGGEDEGGEGGFEHHVYERERGGKRWVSSLGVRWGV